MSSSRPPLVPIYKSSPSGTPYKSTSTDNNENCITSDPSQRIQLTRFTQRPISRTQSLILTSSDPPSAMAPASKSVPSTQESTNIPFIKTPNTPKALAPTSSTRLFSLLRSKEENAHRQKYPPQELLTRVQKRITSGAGVGKPRDVQPSLQKGIASKKVTSKVQPVSFLSNVKQLLSSGNWSATRTTEAKPDSPDISRNKHKALFVTSSSDDEVFVSAESHILAAKSHTASEAGDNHKEEITNANSKNTGKVPLSVKPVLLQDNSLNIHPTRNQLPTTALHTNQAKQLSENTDCSSTSESIRENGSGNVSQLKHTSVEGTSAVLQLSSKNTPTENNGNYRKRHSIILPTSIEKDSSSLPVTPISTQHAALKMFATEKIHCSSNSITVQNNQGKTPMSSLERLPLIQTPTKQKYFAIREKLEVTPPKHVEGAVLTEKEKQETDTIPSKTSHLVNTITKEPLLHSSNLDLPHEVSSTAERTVTEAQITKKSVDAQGNAQDIGKEASNAISTQIEQPLTFTNSLKKDIPLSSVSPGPVSTPHASVTDSASKDLITNRTDRHHLLTDDGNIQAFQAVIQQKGQKRKTDMLETEKSPKQQKLSSTPLHQTHGGPSIERLKLYFEDPSVSELPKERLLEKIISLLETEQSPLTRDNFGIKVIEYAYSLPNLSKFATRIKGLLSTLEGPPLSQAAITTISSTGEKDRIESIQNSINELLASNKKEPHEQVLEDAAVAPATLEMVHTSSADESSNSCSSSSSEDEDDENGVAENKIMRLSTQDSQNSEQQHMPFIAKLSENEIQEADLKHERRKYDRQLDYCIMRKLPNKFLHNKKVISELVITGVPTHTPLSKNSLVSGTNNICSTTNYRSSHVFFYQQFHRGDRLYPIAFDKDQKKILKTKALPKKKPSVTQTLTDRSFAKRAAKESTSTATTEVAEHTIEQEHVVNDDDLTKKHTGRVSEGSSMALQTTKPDNSSMVSSKEKWKIEWKQNLKNAHIYFDNSHFDEESPEVTKKVILQLKLAFTDLCGAHVASKYTDEIDIFILDRDIEDVTKSAGTAEFMAAVNRPASKRRVRIWGLNKTLRFMINLGIDIEQWSDVAEKQLAAIKQSAELDYHKTQQIPVKEKLQAIISDEKTGSSVKKPIFDELSTVDTSSKELSLSSSRSEGHLNVPEPDLQLNLKEEGPHSQPYNDIKRNETTKVSISFKKYKNLKDASLKNQQMAKQIKALAELLEEAYDTAIKKEKDFKVAKSIISRLTKNAVDKEIEVSALRGRIRELKEYVEKTEPRSKL